MIAKRPVPRQSESLANTSRKPLKNRNQTLPAVPHLNRKPESAPNTLWAIAGPNAAAPGSGKIHLVRTQNFSKN